MLSSEVPEANGKPKGSTEATSTHQVDHVNPPAKSYNEAAWDEPLDALPHNKHHDLQNKSGKCWFLA